MASSTGTAAFGVDHRYREWQRTAARLIVAQITDGTLSRVAEVGARVRQTSTQEAMVAQIVAILMSRSSSEQSTES
jgi:hypothetical protein